MWNRYRTNQPYCGYGIASRPFTRTLFTAQELSYCQRPDGTWRAESLAGIFAAKEALFKALGTGFRQGKWTDVEVCHDSLGAPYYQFHGYYAQAVPLKTEQPPSLSIAHDGDYAIAFTVLG